MSAAEGAHKGAAAHLEGSKLVEVCGKQGGAANLSHQVLRDGPGQAEAIVRGRAAPQLVDDDQAALCCTLHTTGQVSKQLGAQHVLVSRAP